MARPPTAPTCPRPPHPPCPAYYYIAYTTIELFASSLTAKTKLKGLLEILSAASEFDDVPVRPGEERVVQKLLQHAPLALDKPRYADPHTKVNALVQVRHGVWQGGCGGAGRGRGSVQAPAVQRRSGHGRAPCFGHCPPPLTPAPPHPTALLPPSCQAHLSRGHLNPDMGADAREVVGRACRLLQAMVDVISSSGWLNPALAAMEMSQMTTQGLWQRDPPLMQLPHVSRELAATCAEKGARRGWVGCRAACLSPLLPSGAVAAAAAPERCCPPFRLTVLPPPTPPAGVETVFDLLEMEDDARRELLQVRAGRLGSGAQGAACQLP